MADEKKRKKDVIAEIASERRRQIESEGFSSEHDDRYVYCELSEAAVCYVMDDMTDWPWAAHWWKPSDRRRNLIKAAALLVAEIERLDRAEPRT